MPAISAKVVIRIGRRRAAGVHQRFFAVHALGFALARRIEQQDRVLRHQAHQHDDADEAHQVEGALGQQQRQHHADQRQRQRHHHAQRRGEGAELHHQDQVHQADAGHQRDRHLGEQLVLVLAGAAQDRP
jgi:hypothetical protein